MTRPRIDTDELRKLLAEVTPGPWYSRGNDQGGSGPDAYVCVDDGRDRVARVMSYTQIGLMDKPYRANATLIALAPELADELLRLHAHAEAMADALEGVQESLIDCRSRSKKVAFDIVIKADRANAAAITALTAYRAATKEQTDE